MPDAARSVFAVHRRLALTVFWPCLLFTVVALFLVLAGAPVAGKPLAFLPLPIEVVAVVLVPALVDRRFTPKSAPDAREVFELGRKMVFARLIAGELVLIIGLLIGIVLVDRTAVLVAAVCTVVLYVVWLRTGPFLVAVRRVLHPLGVDDRADQVLVAPPPQAGPLQDMV